MWNKKSKNSFYPWRDQVSKDTHEATKNWHVKDWEFFRNEFWKSYYKERSPSIHFRRRKLEKIREFNKLKKV